MLLNYAEMDATLESWPCLQQMLLAKSAATFEVLAICVARHERVGQLCLPSKLMTKLNNL